MSEAKEKFNNVKGTITEKEQKLLSKYDLRLFNSKDPAQTFTEIIKDMVGETYNYDVGCYINSSGSKANKQIVENSDGEDNFESGDDDPEEAYNKLAASVGVPIVKRPVENPLQTPEKSIKSRLEGSSIPNPIPKPTHNPKPSPKVNPSQTPHHRRRASSSERKEHSPNKDIEEKKSDTGGDDEREKSKEDSATNFEQ
jgi:hypothetical protein